MLDEDQLVHDYISIKYHNPQISRNQTKFTPNIDDTNKSTKAQKPNLHKRQKQEKALP